jgi:PAS domain S-box-containing protein
MLGRDGNLIFLAADKTTSSGLVSGASVRKSQPVALAQTTAPQASAGKPATRVIETPDFQTNPTLARVIQALRESEERFRLLFATITDAILVFDVQSLQLVEFNEAALRLYGFSRDEMLRLSALDLSAEPEASWKTIERVIEEPQVIPLRLHRKKDGTVFPVEIAANGFDLQGRRMFCGVASAAQGHSCRRAKRHHPSAKAKTITGAMLSSGGSRGRLQTRLDRQGGARRGGATGGPGRCKRLPRGVPAGHWRHAGRTRPGRHRYPGKPAGHCQ